MNKWGITNEKCSEDDKENEHKYNWAEARNDHGAEPAFEALRLYAERCSQLINYLWNKKIKEQVEDVKRRIGHYHSMASEENDEFFQRISHAVENPEKVQNELDTENGITLRSLSVVDVWLIELLWISKIVTSPEEEVLDRSVQVIAEIEELTQEIRKKLAKIFPVFANLSLTDQESIQKHVEEALQAIDKVRRKIIWS